MQCVRNAAPRALLTVYYCLLRVPSGATHFAPQSTHTDTHARVRTPVGSDAAETRRRVNVCVCAVAVVAVVVERNDEATRVMGNNEKYSERLFVAARHASEVHSAINTQGARAGACSDQKFEYIVQDDTTRHSSWGGGFVAFRVVAVSVCLAKLLQAKLQH